MFSYKNGYITNEKGQVVAVQGKSDTENRQVIKENKSKTEEDHQQWNIVYVDESPNVPNKGYDKEWGMKISEPFHIVTQMTSNRYIDLISNRLVIKTPNGKDTQKWYFDFKTKTIKSKSNDQSIDSRNTFLYIYGTNSQWY